MYFVEKIETIRASTGQSPPTTTLPPSTVAFSSFGKHTASARFTRSSSHKPMKSCSLDPIPGSNLKEILPEILPFITTMCNKSLKEGWLPESQRRATLKPILTKDLTWRQRMSKVTVLYIYPIWPSFQNWWSVCRQPTADRVPREAWIFSQTPIWLPCTPFNRNCTPESYVWHHGIDWQGKRYAFWGARHVCCVWHGWPRIFCLSVWKGLMDSDRMRMRFFAANNSSIDRITASADKIAHGHRVT